MKNTLVFATANPNKVAEVQRQLGNAYTFRSLTDIGCTEPVPETTGTIAGNACQKARYVFENYGENCFSEDTGLIVDALDGRPGVDTAHYAGPSRNARANNLKVLSELGNTGARTARFKTVICLVLDGKEYNFEGICEGHIATCPRGNDGFGYDPIFVPREGNGYQTFAQMTTDEKARISHRGRAMQKLMAFLRHQQAGAPGAALATAKDERTTAG